MQKVVGILTFHIFINLFCPTERDLCKDGNPKGKQVRIAPPESCSLLRGKG